MKKLIILILAIGMNSVSQAQVIIEHETSINNHLQSIDFNIKVDVSVEKRIESVTLEKRHFDIVSKEDRRIKASIQSKGVYSSVDLEYESGDSYIILVRIKNLKNGGYSSVTKNIDF